jgi:uncharacterized protein
MAIDHKLLDILCCPATGNPVRPLKKDQLRELNALIERGELRHLDDTPVTEPLKEGLITDNGERIYRIDDGIPVMLEEKAIFGRWLQNNR